MTQIFLWHTTDIRLDSGCPTLCNGCSVLYYRTPHAHLGRVFWCFLFVMTQIFLWYTVDVRLDSGRPTLRNGHGIFFALSDNSCPTRPSVLMFSLFVTIQIFLWYTADVRLCAMAVGFLHYRTTRAQFGWVFWCFPFITFHLSFFQIYFHSYLAYLISDISWGTCI